MVSPLNREKGAGVTTDEWEEINPDFAVNWYLALWETKEKLMKSPSESGDFFQYWL